MEAEADRLEERAAEKEAEEAESESDEDEDWDDENDVSDWEDDDDEESEEEDDDDDDDEDDENCDIDRDAAENEVREWFSEHTEAFIEKALETEAFKSYAPRMYIVAPKIFDDIEKETYALLSPDEVKEDIAVTQDLSDATIEFMDEVYDETFESYYYQDFIDAMNTYEEAYQEGLKRYKGDEEKARQYAEERYHEI